MLRLTRNTPNTIQPHNNSTSLVSVYEFVNGREPECTNHCVGFNGGPLFSNTIDMILGSNVFFSQVERLQSRDELGRLCSLPTESEPSDHMLLGAEFCLLE